MREVEDIIWRTTKARIRLTEEIEKKMYLKRCDYCKTDIDDKDRYYAIYLNNPTEDTTHMCLPCWNRRCKKR